MAESTTVTLPNITEFKRKALIWANYFNTVCLLDSNQYPHKNYKSKDWVLAVDAVDELICGDGAFEKLKVFQAAAGSTIFGFLTYDLKNQVEKLESSHADGLGFPELYFFKPRYIIEVAGEKVTLNRNYPETFELIELIGKMKVDEIVSDKAPLKLLARTPKAKYLQNVTAIKKQIEEGDFYEMNYCTEFYSEDAELNPINVFSTLNEQAKAPFSAFFKCDNRYLMCASPERFLRKESSKLISQPIKGTIKKGVTEAENEQLQTQLRNDIKERAENVMIVDLVRNDLAKSAVAGSVKVEELFGVYSFNSVNQMISTITAELKPGVDFTDAIKNAFPMGSMTGAPKVEVMKNIERYEDVKRGLYSGAVGYITGAEDFDFNVVIRSIFYSAITSYISIQAGGAITYDSIPEKEYEEILLKAQGMMRALNAGLLL
jgi:para-aminobenzoate synthetase component 1